MKHLVVLFLFLASGASFAIYEVGSIVPNMCWQNVESKNVCLIDVNNNVRVLVYGAGWCTTCGDELSDLASSVSEFDGMAVTFINLMVQGDRPGSPPDQFFLLGWKLRHKIPFTVAASPGDAGKSFFNPPYYLPSTVIIDRKGLLSFKGIDVSKDRLFEKIRELLVEYPSK